MSLETFISRHVVAIDAHIRRQVPNIGTLDDDERRLDYERRVSLQLGTRGRSRL